MAGENDRQDTSQSQSSDDAGDKKLIFGKYKTMEDAEKAHKDLERNFHQGNEKFSRLEEKFDRFASQIEEGYGRGQQREEHQAQSSNSNQVLTEFYRDPEKVLNSVEERAVRRTREALTREGEAARRRAERVEKWTQQNQDVAAEPELLTYWVGQTDARLDVETRLDKAAEVVRKRILERGAKRSAASPEPDEIVEGVDQGGAPRQHAAEPVKRTDAESQLSAYATTRNRQARKPLGMPRQK